MVERANMSIGRRLGLSFTVILALFAVNLIVYFWGNGRRNESVEDLRQAITRQILAGSIKQAFTDLQQQVTLISGVAVGSQAHS